jgi:hypothetical protein
MSDLCHVDIVSSNKDFDLFKSKGLRLTLEDNVKEKRAVAVYDGDEHIGYVMRIFRGLAAEEIVRGSKVVVVSRWSDVLWRCALVNDGTVSTVRTVNVRITRETKEKKNMCKRRKS